MLAKSQFILPKPSMGMDFLPIILTPIPREPDIFLEAPTCSTWKCRFKVQHSRATFPNAATAAASSAIMHTDDSDIYPTHTRQQCRPFAVAACRPMVIKRAGPNVGTSFPCCEAMECKAAASPLQADGGQLLCSSVQHSGSKKISCVSGSRSRRFHNVSQNHATIQWHPPGRSRRPKRQN